MLRTIDLGKKAKTEFFSNDPNGQQFSWDWDSNAGHLHGRPAC